MHAFITLASLTLLLSACGGESSESLSTPSTSPSGTPASAFSDSLETESASTRDQPSGQTSRALGAGDPTEGAALFGQPTIAGTPGCVVCHSLEPDVRMVGPSMADAATVAAGAVEGTSAEVYLRQSIVEPNAHVKEGFMPDLMFQDYGDKLSVQQIDDLVAFLLTQT